MNKNINEKVEKEMGNKHYNRMKGFLRYDIEERNIEEQKEILEQTIKVCNDMLKAMETE
jgi:hypothetical protein